MLSSSRNSQSPPPRSPNQKDSETKQIAQTLTPCELLRSMHSHFTSKVEIPYTNPREELLISQNPPNSGVERRKAVQNVGP